MKKLGGLTAGACLTVFLISPVMAAPDETVSTQQEDAQVQQEESRVQMPEPTQVQESGQEMQSTQPAEQIPELSKRNRTRLDVQQMKEMKRRAQEEATQQE